MALKPAHQVIIDILKDDQPCKEFLNHFLLINLDDREGRILLALFLLLQTEIPACERDDVIHALDRALQSGHVLMDSFLIELVTQVKQAQGWSEDSLDINDMPAD